MSDKSNKRSKKVKGKKKNNQEHGLHSHRSGMTVYKAPGVTLIPDVFCCKMKYRERLSVASLGGSFGYYQFSSNSLFDPNVTGTGLQPEGFDQLSALYRNYRVVASKISLRVASDVAGSFELAVMVQPTGTLPTVFEAIAAAPYSKKTIGMLTSNPVVRLDLGITTHKLFGVEAEGIIDVPAYYSGATGNLGTGSSPSYQGVFTLAIRNVSTSSNITGIIYCDLVYDTEFFSRVTADSLSATVLQQMPRVSEAEVIIGYPKKVCKN